jgi:DNA replication protein DnaC
MIPNRQTRSSTLALRPHCKSAVRAGSSGVTLLTALSTASRPRTSTGTQRYPPGIDVRFTKTSRCLADLAGGHADRTWDKRLREYTRPAVLILDDFAMREFTSTQADDLYELTSERAATGKSLIITSNRSPNDWYPLFPNPVVAESLLDRLINTSHQLLVDGPSYRPRTRPRPADSTRQPNQHSSRTITTGQHLGKYLIRTPGEIRAHRQTSPRSRL